MANRTKLGAIVKQEGGYKIRQMGTNKNVTIKGKEKKIFQHNGTYGVYSGRKKLIKDGFKQITEAVTHIKEKL